MLKGGNQEHAAALHFGRVEHEPTGGVGCRPRDRARAGGIVWMTGYGEACARGRRSVGASIDADELRRSRLLVVDGEIARGDGRQEKKRSSK
jgi:hypothetical protein